MIEQLLIIFLVILVSLFVCYPYFLNRKEENIGSFSGISEIEKLNEKKDLYISEIRDIEFDYGLGKLSENDYKVLLETYKAKAADVMEKLEKIDESEKNEIISSEIEKEILRFRKVKSS